MWLPPWRWLPLENWCVQLLNIIVTGGSRGLGLGIAERLAATGCQVVAIARKDSDHLREAIDRVRLSGTGSIAFRAGDLSDIASIPILVKDIRQEFGRVSALVNNAGIGTSGLLANMRDPQIEELMTLNVVSPITLTKYIVRAMMADGAGGRIVNLSSIVGFTGFKGLSAYSATKAAIIGFTRSLAREVGPMGITVNAVAPGFIDTEMTHGLTGTHREQIIRRSALRRLAETEDVANAVEYLLSDKARNITGTVMTVDGGNTA
jgi:3-oxoacyl-[acyl-carrier protein] reductase